MKYQVYKNEKLFVETDDFKTALIAYTGVMQDFKTLDMPTDFCDLSVELQMLYENKFMRTTFKIDDIE